MTQGVEEITRKISTQFKLLAAKETELLTTRNKKGEMEKHLKYVELQLEKLQEFKYSVQEGLLDEGKMKNLEKWCEKLWKRK